MDRVKSSTEKTELPISHLPSPLLGQEGNKSRYCSLDIETTGFDPLTEEILEVGFCFFELPPTPSHSASSGQALEKRGSKNGIKIVEEWTQVFKPSKEVNSKILGLTGITQKELENAPKFSEYKEFLQGKLGDAVIVGHNIIFDIRFLEQFGIKFSGGKIDTLDLVQWLLPTRHSYNLENLMHYFKVSHTEAHRALADAKAALKVLEKLLNLFSGFPKELKKEIQSLIQPFGFLWKEWLFLDIKNKEKNVIVPAEKIKSVRKIKTDLKLLPKNIYNFPLFYEYLEDVLGILIQTKDKALVVLPKKSMVMQLWKGGLVEPVFLGEDLFDEKKFEKYLNKKDKSEEEVKFLLKILVWKNINWQNICLLDLNLSFFGGQFKEMIAKNKTDYNVEAKLLACDYASFYELAENNAEKDRKIVLISLPDFENSLSIGIGQKVSWGYISYLLKGVYNPEIQIGSEKHKALVLEMLSATDLFFGLSCALLKNDPTGFEYFKVTETTQYFENFIKLQKASEGYIEKLKKAGKVFKMESLITAAKNLESFFKEEPNRVKWLELAETRSVFFNSPLRLDDLIKKIVRKYPKIIFVDSLPKGSVLDLFVSRLGLEEFEIKEVKAAFAAKSAQQDLFSLLSFRKATVEYSFLEKSLENKSVLEWCKKTNLPLAVLFQNPLAVREFYEQNFQELGQRANLLTQNQSGGSNKIFRNFSIYKESILLATDKFVLKYLENTNTALESLVVKTLIIGRLPFEQYTHPYLEAVASAFKNPFEQFSLPRAILNMMKVLKFFYTSDLKEVVLADSKLQKPYSKAFKDLFAEISNFKLK